MGWMDAPTGFMRCGAPAPFQHIEHRYPLAVRLIKWRSRIILELGYQVDRLVEEG
jgi:hypothetical protein